MFRSFKYDVNVATDGEKVGMLKDSYKCLCRRWRSDGVAMAEKRREPLSLVGILTEKVCDGKMEGMT
jgi:hypothetical protein